VDALPRQHEDEGGEGIEGLHSERARRR
jgi:hypothetical protein